MAKIFTQWELRVDFVDQGRNTTSRTYGLDFGDADLVADVEAAASNVVAALGNISNCFVTGFSIRKVYADDNVIVPTNAQVENTGVVSVDIDGNPLKKATLSIPGVSPSVFVDTVSGPNNNIMNLVNADLVTFVDLFKTTGVATLSDGEYANAIVDGVRVHRRSGKSRSRRFG